MYIPPVPQSPSINKKEKHGVVSEPARASQRSNGSVVWIFFSPFKRIPCACLVDGDRPIRSDVISAGHGPKELGGNLEDVFRTEEAVGDTRTRTSHPQVAAAGARNKTPKRAREQRWGWLVLIRVRRLWATDVERMEKRRLRYMRTLIICLCRFRD